MNIPYHVSALHLIYKMVESNEKREGKAFIFTHNEELYATPWQEKIKCYYIFFCPSYPKVSQNGLQLIWKYSTRREFGLRIRIQRWLWRRWRIGCWKKSPYKQKMDNHYEISIWSLWRMRCTKFIITLLVLQFLHIITLIQSI